MPETERKQPKTKKTKTTKTRTQRCGNYIRVTIFSFNACVWIASIFALLGGLMVGFSNGTFTMDAAEDDRYAEGDVRWRDFLLTTPATLLVYYGILMLLVTSFGCFSSSGSQRCCNITYLIALVLLFIFDLAFGIRAFFDKFAMDRFMRKMEVAMDQYGTKDTTKIGVIPMGPKEYWDYLQYVGKCCGMTKYQDWRNRTIGKPENGYSIPDSCCNKDYAHNHCGWRVWEHFDGDFSHFRKDMIKRTGCISIFPEELTTVYHEWAFVVILLGVFLILCFILTIVLLVFIFRKKYKAHQGPEYRQHHHGDHEHDAPLPVVWTHRSRREAMHIPLPDDDQNYKVNEPVYFTPEMLQREQENQRHYGHEDERMPFSSRPIGNNRLTTGAGGGRTLTNQSAEKIYQNREFGKESRTDLANEETSRPSRKTPSPSPLDKTKVKNVRSA